MIVGELHCNSQQEGNFADLWEVKQGGDIRRVSKGGSHWAIRKINRRIFCFGVYFSKKKSKI